MKREVFSYVFAVDASDVAVAVMIIYIGLLYGGCPGGATGFSVRYPHFSAIPRTQKSPCLRRSVASGLRRLT